MSVVKELYLITKSLYDHLQQDLPKDLDERDMYIDQIHEFLNQREDILPNLDGSLLNECEKKIGEVIVKLNKVIDEKLNEEKALIQSDIANVKIKRKAGRKYENPYAGPTIDGMFIDKRNI